MLEKINGVSLASVDRLKEHARGINDLLIERSKWQEALDEESLQEPARNLIAQVLESDVAEATLKSATIAANAGHSHEGGTKNDRQKHYEANDRLSKRLASEYQFHQMKTALEQRDLKIHDLMKFYDNWDDFENLQATTDKYSVLVDEVFEKASSIIMDTHKRLMNTGSLEQNGSDTKFSGTPPPVAKVVLLLMTAIWALKYVPNDDIVHSDVKEQQLTEFQNKVLDDVYKKK